MYFKYKNGDVCATSEYDLGACNRSEKHDSVMLEGATTRSLNSSAFDAHNAHCASIRLYFQSIVEKKP